MRASSTPSARGCGPTTTSSPERSTSSPAGSPPEVGDTAADARVTLRAATCDDRRGVVFEAESDRRVQRSGACHLGGRALHPGKACGARRMTARGARHGGVLFGLLASELD